MSLLFLLDFIKICPGNFPGRSFVFWEKRRDKKPDFPNIMPEITIVPGFGFVYNASIIAGGIPGKGKSGKFL
jgi:predicted ATP-dependent serine protease